MDAKRLSVAKEVWWGPFMWVANSLFVTYGAATAIRDFFPTETQEKYQLNRVLPHWQWRTWLLLFVGINVLVILEGAFRVVRKRESAHEGTKRELNLEREKHQTPDIHGDILGVFWDFVTINKKPDFNLLDIFVRLRLVNHEDIGTTTKESRLRIEFKGGHYEATGESPGLGKIVHESSYRDEFTSPEAKWGEEFGVVTSVAPFYPHIPLQIAVEQKGWIKFRIEGEFKDQPPNCDVDVTIVDSLGGNHSIHGKHLPFYLGQFKA
jgi:hypothetical protein